MSNSTGVKGIYLAISFILLPMSANTLIAQTSRLKHLTESGRGPRAMAVEFIKQCHDPAWVESDDAWFAFTAEARSRINRRDATAFLERLQFADPDSYRARKSSGTVGFDSQVELGTPTEERVMARLHFRVENDAWRLFAASRYDLSEDLWRQVNLEQLRTPSSALKLAFTPDYDRLIEASLSVGERRFLERSQSMAKSRNMSPTDFEATWKINVDFRNRSARSVLEELLTEWGLGLNRLEGTERDLSRRIDLQLSSVSRFQVIEAICRQAGLRPIYERGPIAKDGFFEFASNTLERLTPGAIWLVLPPRGSRGGSVTVAPGLRTTQVAFPGPFLVELEEVVERAPYATGSVRLSWVSAGMPHPRVDFPGLWRPELRPLELKSELSGFARFVPRAGFDSDRWIERGELINQHTSQRVEGLKKNVKRLNMRNGTIGLTLPAESVVQEIRHLEVGAQAGYAGRWVFIDQLFLSESSNRSWIQVRYHQVSSAQIQFWAFDAEGRRLPTSYFDRGTTGRLSIEGHPSRLAVHFRQEGEHLEYPFKFSSVALEKHREQPVSLPELKFPDGEAPLRIRVSRCQKTRFNSWELLLELENKSNKDIVEAAFSPVEMEDGKRDNWLGQEIHLFRNRPETAASTWPDGHREILVRAGESTEIIRNIHESYNFAEDMSALAVRVNFADETNWTFVVRP